MFESIEAQPVERWSVTAERERVSRDRPSREIWSRGQPSHRVFDDRVERARIGTEGWRVQTKPVTNVASGNQNAPKYTAPPYSGAWDQREGRPRMASGIFPSPPWAGGNSPPPSTRPSLEAIRRSPGGYHGNFYGNYFGWGDNSHGENPISPLDLVAWYHDLEYGAIQSHYGADEDPLKAWFEPFSRFDEPDFMYDLAMSDLRFNENSWAFIAEGMDQGFYKGAPGLLAADIIMSSVAWIWHTALSAVRLAWYGVQVVFGGLYKFLTGEMNLGDYLKSVLQGGAKILAGVGYFVAGTIRGVGKFLGSTIRGVINDPARGLSGAAAGAAVGSVLGPVGAVAGGIIGAAVGGSGGCFITTAVCEEMKLPDDHEILQDFRMLRDSYMSKDPSTSKLVDLYYQVSPEILDSIENRGDKSQIYKRIFSEFLIPAHYSIKKGHFRSAVGRYMSMVLWSSRLVGKRFLIVKMPAIDKFTMLSDCNPISFHSATAV